MKESLVLENLWGKTCVKKFKRRVSNVLKRYTNRRNKRCYIRIMSTDLKIPRGFVIVKFARNSQNISTIGTLKEN